MQKISTNKAPEAIGHYEQGYVANGVIYTSMQIPLVTADLEQPATMTIQEQALQALKNATAIVCEAGGNKETIIQVRLYVTDMDRFMVVNEMYESFMGSHKPARSVVGVSSLPKGFSVAVEMIAELSEK